MEKKPNFTQKSRLTIFVICFLFFILCSVSIWQGIYSPKNIELIEERLFLIERGERFREIAKNLEKENIIRWAPFFKVYVILRGKINDLQAGPYFLSPSMNIPEIAEKFISGNIAKVKITIPEGFTAVQIRERLQSVLELDFNALEEYEGYLFPDTYYIPYGMTEEGVIKMMTDNFERRTAGLAVTDRVVIMASILEREVKTKEEKELAAGVLWKRLANDWPLQVDVYMWTYENRGLPPRPIANPGLESILAALYPKESEYWFYLSKPDGETIFHKTYQEHNYAIQKYLR